jgi:ribosomal protein L7/L12
MFFYVLNETAKSLWERGRHIAAVRLYHTLTGLSIREAREVLEGLCADVVSF